MNDRVVRRPRWTARRSAVLIAVVLLTAACGGGPSSSGSGDPQGAEGSASGSASPSPLAFSACMRSRGVSSFPDPDSSGAIPKVGPQQLGVSTSRFQQAQGACAYLLQPSDAQVQQTLDGMRDFAQCMRSHGVSNWPDPSTDNDGQPVFDLRGQINPDTQRIDTTSGACSHLLHPAPGEDGAFLCNGIGDDGCHHYGRPD
ncbi:hypothetical protein ACXC9Q_30370 [Kribbella sp. CWNU-51]